MAPCNFDVASPIEPLNDLKIDVESDTNEHHIEVAEEEEFRRESCPVDVETVLHIPSLYPCYLPFTAQHLILTTTQSILESFCFSLARTLIPGYLHHRGWDCPSSVELRRWVDLFKKMAFESLPMTIKITEQEWRSLLNELQTLRNAAVHRIANTARRVSHLLRRARYFCTVLDGASSARAIKCIQDAVDNEIYAMEANKKTLESRTNKACQDIEKRRAALRQEQKEIISAMVNLDKEKQLEVELCLLRVVHNIDIKATVT